MNPQIVRQPVEGGPRSEVLAVDVIDQLHQDPLASVCQFWMLEIIDDHPAEITVSIHVHETLVL
jgi:hypothetical protein